MSVDSKINEIESARNTIRSKMVAAGQASSSDKLADLADNLTFDKYYSTDDSTESILANDDYVPFYDTSATTKKKSTWNNIKSKLKTYFDTLYPSKTTFPDPTSGDSGKFLRGDSTWQEISAGDGHTIEDPEGTALTQRDTLQFGGDLEVSDDDENEKTVVSPHELTAAELTEIVTPLPSVPVNMPILFDETGTEHVVGWYKYANGTKQPVYEKAFNFGAILTTTGWHSNAHGISNIDMVVNSIGYAKNVNGNNTDYLPIPYIDLGLVFRIGMQINKTNIAVGNSEIYANVTKVLITLQYTKTTDTPT